MIAFLADQNFNARIVRGLLLRDRSISIIRLEQTVMDGAADPDVLAYAASEGRVVITHDRNTMAGFAHDRVRRGETMPGVIIVDDHLGVGDAIDELLLIAGCMSNEDLTEQVIWVPLR